MKQWKKEKIYIKNIKPCRLSYMVTDKEKKQENRVLRKDGKIMTGRELIEQIISNGDIDREIIINVKGSLMDFIFYADKNNNVDVEAYPTIADVKNNSDEYVSIETKIEW